MSHDVNKAQVTSIVPLVPYATVTVADEYFGSRLSQNDVWNKLTDDQKLAALKEATLDLDAVPWIGRRYHSLSQIREWPRWLNSPSAELPFGDLTPVEFGIPEVIAYGTCEQAFYIGKNFIEGADHEARRDHQDQGVSNISRVGGSESYDLTKARRNRLTPRAREVVRDYIAKTGNLESPFSY